LTARSKAGSGGVFEGKKRKILGQVDARGGETWGQSLLTFNSRRRGERVFVSFDLEKEEGKKGGIFP